MVSGKEYFTLILHCFGVKKDTFSYRPFLIVTFSVCILAQAILSAAKRWDDLGARYLAVEDINLSWFCTAILMEFSFVPNNAWTLLSIADRNFFQYDFIQPKSIRDYIKESNEAMNTKINAYVRIMFIFYGIRIFPPFFLTVYTFYQGKETEYTDRNLPLPQESWYPFPTNAIHIYLLLYAINFLYEVIMCLNALCIMALGMTSMHHLSCEIRLLSLTILNIDKIISNDSFWNKRDLTNDYDDYDDVIEDTKSVDYGSMFSNETAEKNSIYEIRLKLFTSMIVQHHMSINRYGFHF